MASSQPSETISNFYETTCMDSELFLAAANGQLDVFTALDLVYILTPEKNTVLHVNIITSESTDISFAVGIVEMCPPLLQQTNARGETPLLLAARYGRHCIVEFLINRAKTLFEQDDLEKANAAVNNEVFKQIMRIPNQNKDTALHEAVRFNHLEVVRILTKEDPHFPYSTNEDGETPLYLAVEGGLGYLGLADEILQNCPSPATSGPKGRTVLHVAVTLCKEYD
ncbi:ankyrin repeat-containing protein At5g02620-like [Humulus lupulus]|uniref:ankyrin repeat-containing protein At5g02620-like n=1 Tax=Humulus lupulus TaxID=3486 RepID=UPI002B412824|nr:ankyrin repeat-containing protein At5g02620-like [Humulus lupulus]